MFSSSYRRNQGKGKDTKKPLPNFTSSSHEMVKTVVILGAGWAGLPLAHKLLKHTLPVMKNKKDPLKVILISPNTHFYWNVAATRGIIPGAIPDSQLFLPIAPGFSTCTADEFEFVLGKATRLFHPERDVVEVALNNDDKNNGDINDDVRSNKLEIPYDHLIIATGSQIRNSNGMTNLPLKPLGTHETTLSAFHTLKSRIATAQSITIAGAGPTGVEVAGELAAAYDGASNKEITLIMSGEHVLQTTPNVLPSVVEIVERDLQKLGVKIVRNARVEHVADDENQSSKTSSSSSTSKTTLTLSTGTHLTTDLYIPLFGVSVNTSFIPPHLLDTSSDNLSLTPTLLVSNTTNIWGIGDVGNLEAKQLTLTDAQIIHLASTLHAILTTTTTKTTTTKTTSTNNPEEKYKPNLKPHTPSKKVMLFLSLGKKHATGQIGTWRLWSWMVGYVKGRALFVDTAEDYVNGRRLRHGSV